MHNPYNLDALVAYILDKADELESDAGYSGAMNDHGASALRNEVYAFQAGRRGEVPPRWLGYLENMTKESDPEYAEYQRLKKKFGG